MDAPFLFVLGLREVLSLNEMLSHFDRLSFLDPPWIDMHTWAMAGNEPVLVDTCGRMYLQVLVPCRRSILSRYRSASSCTSLVIIIGVSTSLSIYCRRLL